jgi:leucyl-tRNA synthetase
MWSRLGRRPYVCDRPWPVADAELAREEEVEIAVQVNGRVRGHVTVPVETPEEELRRRAQEEPHVREHVAGKAIRRVVVVPGRLVNIVTE